MSSRYPLVPAKIDTTCSSTAIGACRPCFSSSTRRSPRSSCAFDTASSSEPNVANASSSRNCARSSFSVPDTDFIALICAAPPTRDTEMPTSTAGRTPDLKRSSCEVDLAVGDRDHVGGDVRRDVAGLGLDDRQRGERTGAQLVAQLRGALEQAASGGRRRRRGTPRGPAGGGAATRSGGTPRPASTGRRRRRARPRRSPSSADRSRNRSRARGT